MLCITVFVRKLLLSVHAVTCHQTTMELFLNDDFQDLFVGEVSRLMQSQSNQNLLLNTLIHRLIHNVAEPVLLTVLERQPKQRYQRTLFIQLIYSCFSRCHVPTNSIALPPPPV